MGPLDEADGRELVDGAFYPVRQVKSDGGLGPWTVGRWDAHVTGLGASWTVLDDNVGFGVAKVGFRVPMPDEEPDTGEEAELPDDVEVEDCDDGLVTLWVDEDGTAYAELTPPQARTLAAKLVRMAAVVEAAGEDDGSDEEADEETIEPASAARAGLPGLTVSPVPRWVSGSFDASDISYGFLIGATWNGVALHAKVPYGTLTEWGYVRHDSDGKPTEYRTVDGLSCPFVPETTAAEVRTAAPEAEKPEVLPWLRYREGPR